MAEEEQESGRGFRVQDRRRFSPETGEPRTTEEMSPAKDEPISTEQTRPQPIQADTTSGTMHSTAPPPQITFASFLLGLSTQALMFMGEIPPVPGQPVQTDLVAAQQMIDVLAMLKQKTAGNLDPGEDAMLNNALFDLRMRYVDLAKKKP